MAMQNNISTIAFDADDTLWHNERHFAQAQKTFEFLLADYADADDVHSVLLETERRNIPLYGFGVKGFVLSMLEAASTLTARQAPSLLNDSILALGRQMLAHPVELLPSVQSVLQDLHGRYRLVLITKGDLAHQERKISSSQIADVFDRIDIVSDKNPSIYQRILGQDIGRAMMVGNSLKSDVLPAIEAGAIGVYVPHDITFALEHAELPQDQSRCHVLDNISQLPALIDKLDRTQ